MWYYILFGMKRRLCMSVAAIMLATVYAFGFTVVIDPGHGGKDYGATGKITNEKSINLAVAKLVADHLGKVSPETNILLTRDKDIFLTLKERADFANKNNGDLFVSIHVNSVDKRNKNRANIQGASVYTLGLHKSEANFEVAKRENSVMSLDPDFSATYEGFDPNSSESYIIFEMGQNKHMAQSINLARQIQTGLTSSAGRADRGVRQAGFWVLWATGMPSVLVELDFICNPEQEKFLASKEGQKKMADAIGKAITSYMDSHDNAPTDYQPAAEEEEEDYGEEQDGESVVFLPAGDEDTEITYHVQILASAKALKKGSPELKGEDAKEIRDGKWFKYYVGHCGSLKEAKNLASGLRKKFPEAFIIKIQGGKIKNE